MAWLQRAPERIRRRRMGKFRLSFYDADDWPIDYVRNHIGGALQPSRRQPPLPPLIHSLPGLSPPWPPLYPPLVC